MILRITEPIEAWEAIVAIELAMSLDAALYCEQHQDLIEHSGVEIRVNSMDESKTLAFSAAYRAVDRSEDPYIAVLAKESGLGGIKGLPPAFQRYRMEDNATIVVCPKALRSDMDLPIAIWPAIVRFLRSYGLRVLIVGEDGYRMDAGAFSEAEILCDVPIHRKIEALAAANIIIGVPCSWTLMAASWVKRMIIFYPDILPITRWFWIDSSRFTKIRYDLHHLSIPALLAGLRQTIARLD